MTDKFLVQPKVEIDAPVIITESTTATGAIRELADTTSSTAIDSVSGTIAFKDVDLNDAHTVGQSAPTFEWSGGTLSEDQKAALTEANTLTLTETDSSGTGFGSVAWTHSAADGAFDFLAKGETLTVQYNVTVDDGHGGPAASQAVTITITGANDAPAVSAAIPMRQTTASWRTLRTAPPSASRRTQPIPTKETPSPISSPAIRTIYSRLMPIPAS